MKGGLGAPLPAWVAGGAEGVAGRAKRRSGDPHLLWTERGYSIFMAHARIIRLIQRGQRRREFQSRELLMPTKVCQKFSCWKFYIGKVLLWKFYIGKVLLWKFYIEKVLLWKFYIEKVSLWKFYIGKSC